MKRLFFMTIGLFLVLGLFAQSGAPASYYAYQNAVYAQNMPLAEQEALYAQAVLDVTALSSNEITLMFQAALEELRVRTFIDAKKIEDALPVLENGIALAEQSLDKKQTAQGYAVLSALHSIGTKVKKTSMLSTGLKIQDATKKSLKIDPKNPAAVHLQASSLIYAPVPFRNLKKGIAIAQDYLEKLTENITPTELFDLTVCIANAYYILGDTETADIWYEKGALIFPNNRALVNRDF